MIQLESLLQAVLSHKRFLNDQLTILNDQHVQATDTDYPAMIQADQS